MALSLGGELVFQNNGGSNDPSVNLQTQNSLLGFFKLIRDIHLLFPQLGPLHAYSNFHLPGTGAL